MTQEEINSNEEWFKFTEDLQKDNMGTGEFEAPIIPESGVAPAQSMAADDAGAGGEETIAGGEIGTEGSL